MNLIRKYKLYLLNIYEDDEKEFFIYVQDLFTDLKRNINYQNHIVYHNNSECIFMIVPYLYDVAYIGVEHFNKSIKFDDEDIRTLFKFIINLNYNLKTETLYKE